MPLNYSISLLPNPAKPAEAKKAYDLGRADAMRRAAALLRWVQRAN